MFRNLIFAGIISRPGMIFLNLLLVFLLAFSVCHSVRYLFNTTNDAAAADDLIDAIAAMLVAYGVVLEERDTIRAMLRKKCSEPEGSVNDESNGDAEEKIDHYAHYCGTTLVVIGLFIEVLGEMVKIPHHIYNFKSLEDWLFGIAFVFMFMSAWAVIHFSFQLSHASGK